MQVLVICNWNQCNIIFWFQRASIWSPRSWVETFMQLKIIFSSSEEKQSSDSVSLIWFCVILVFASALIWKVALVVWILNVFSANRVTDPLLSFFSQFWQHLSLPLGLACPSSLSLSTPVASSPTFCGAEHPVVTQSGTCGCLSPKCASLCAGTGSGWLPCELFSCGSWWFSSLLETLVYMV